MSLGTGTVIFDGDHFKVEEAVTASNRIGLVINTARLGSDAMEPEQIEGFRDLLSGWLASRGYE